MAPKINVTRPLNIPQGAAENFCPKCVFASSSSASSAFAFKSSMQSKELTKTNTSVPSITAEMARSRPLPIDRMATDLNVMVSKTSSIEDPAEKVAARKELAQGLLARKLSMLERCIPEGSDWIVGPKITIADIAIWRLLGWLSSGILDGIPTHILKGFPNIRRVCLAVDTHPKVREWVAMKYPENYNRGQY